jgi:hypothetical protein
MIFRLLRLPDPDRQNGIAQYPKLGARPALTPEHPLDKGHIERLILLSRATGAEASPIYLEVFCLAFSVVSVDRDRGGISLNRTDPTLMHTNKIPLRKGGLDLPRGHINSISGAGREALRSVRSLVVKEVRWA